ASMNLGIPNLKRFLLYAILLSSPALILAIAGTRITQATVQASFAIVASWTIIACFCSVTGFLLVGSRPDDWLFGQLAWDSGSSYPGYVPHVTFLRMHQIEESLTDWLQADWKKALMNATE